MALIGSLKRLLNKVLKVIMGLSGINGLDSRRNFGFNYDQPIAPLSPKLGETWRQRNSTTKQLINEYIWTGTAWKNLTLSDVYVIDTVFNELKHVNPNHHNLVIAKGYWAADGTGGGIFEWDASSTRPVDGGKVFFSNLSTTGRWIRKFSDGFANVLDYGAVTSSFSPLGYPLAPGPIPLFSQFVSLTELSNWYSLSVTSLTQSINDPAFQSCHLNNSSMYIPRGSYILTTSIKVTNDRTIKGSGIDATILYFYNCSGIELYFPTPPVASAQYYLRNLVLEDFNIQGNANYVLPTPNPYVPPSIPALDETRCGINFPEDDYYFTFGAAPVVKPYLTLAYHCNFNNLRISNFAGHGFKAMSMFSSSLVGIKVTECSGHCIMLTGGNTISLRNCEASRAGIGYASYRIYGGANLISCNGNDTPYSTWLHIGATPTNQYTKTNFRGFVHLLNCNLEGTATPIKIEEGSFTNTLILEKCAIQAIPTAGQEYAIFDYGAFTSIILKTTEITTVADYWNGVTTPSTLKAHIKFVYKPNPAVSSEQFSCRYRTEDMYSVSPSFVRQFQTAALFKADEVTPLYTTLPTLTTIDIPNTDSYFLRQVVTSPATQYADLLTTMHKNTNITKLYIGESTVANPETPSITSGTGSPNGIVSAIVGSMYLRVDGSAGSTLYIKESGSGATGWVAK